jgi:hypothetical protein
MRFFPTLLLLLLLSALTLSAALAVDADRGEWVGKAAARAPMTVEETKAFMKRLAQYVLEHHLKRDEKSAQRGMIYEYYAPGKQGTPRQWLEGEGLDTMHDGSWFAVAMVNAFRATGDPFYKEVLTRWQLPFYLKMLNHSDELFTSERNDAPPGAERGWSGSKEWNLQGREKGFVPYWWDDGASTSINIVGRVLRKAGDHVEIPARNELAGKPNPEGLLSGYSLGSSNHLAQDLAVMLEVSWLLFHESPEPAEQRLAQEIAEAALHLQECRTRHGSAGIPAVVGAAALANNDAELGKKLAADSWDSVRKGKNHFLRATADFKPGEQEPVPGFADDVEYRYYHQLAKSRTLAKPVAWKTAFDALTEPQLYRLYSDDSPAPPGISVFDLYPFKFIDGKPMDLRSERKGPNKGPRPIGSRFGPQNMICCGWGIQALHAYPGMWEATLTELGEKTLPLLDKANPQEAPGFWRTSAGVEGWLRRELGGGLRTWEAIFDQYGYIPTGLGTNDVVPGQKWEEMSDTGGYAHLIGAGAQWIYVLEGKRDWEEMRVPRGE